MGVRLLIGTAKGGFWATSPDRETWDVQGPFFEGWKVTTALRLADGRVMAGLASDVYGPVLQVTSDLESWRQLPRGPAYETGGGRRLRQIWTLAENAGVLYAGVQDAGIFASDDGGAAWRPVEGLNEHRTRGAWMPGAGGLCCHALLFGAEPGRMWCGISAVGVFRTDDGGATWTPKNEGVPAAIADKEHKGIGTCVHGLAQDPDDPDRLFRQDHLGMFRTRDGGERWERNEDGLPSGFGFPIVLDRATKALFAVPQESDQRRLPPGGALRVFRSADEGDSWHSASSGLPSRNFFGTVLRGAMAVDDLSPGGVYFGTSAGTLHASADLGESWTNLPVALPRVLHVSAWAD